MVIQSPEYPGVGESTPSIEPYNEIGFLRGQIDALDEAITRLVAGRAVLSARIQTARVHAGGTRVELGRERIVLETYRAALGNSGPGVADAILQVCRGPRSY